MKASNMTNKILPTLSMLVYIFLWAPVIILILFSFSSNRFGIKWESFTLQWYFDIIGNVAVRDALIRSLTIASITIVVATIAGTIAAYGLYKYKFHGRGALRTTILLPMVMPSVVTGGALLVFFSRAIHIPLGYLSITIAHITFCTPLAMFVVLGRMARIDWSLEEASADLGADRLTTWRKITIPVLLPAMIASASLIFPWSFDDFIITYFVAGVGTTTLPIYIFSQLRFGATPVINTIGTILVVLPIISVLLMHFLQKKN
ncbi:Inner membrane ABC transporter permease protein YdcV [subsurface metagenome]